MPGRFSLALSMESICDRYNAAYVGEKTWRARYNIPPGQYILTIINADRRIVQPMRWGLIPRWAKDQKVGYKMINARAETLSEKPTYKKIFMMQRCIIPADGFYEWKDTEKGKIPYRIVPKEGELFSFAGLWERWVDPESHQPIMSCVTITTVANSLLKDIHDRMPLILTADHEELWLNPQLTEPNELTQCLTAYPSDLMHYYEVSQVVNSYKNDSPECIKPLN